jgi:5-methylcytosine-specific restriction endonuclease McrA
VRPSRRRLVLAIVASDATFALDPRHGWVGKCIHCNSSLVVSEAGEPEASATIEHIVPEAKGGTEALTNLALACARCNYGKGKRHDARDTDRATQVTQALLERRQARWRDPETR